MKEKERLKSGGGVDEGKMVWTELQQFFLKDLQSRILRA